MGILLSLFQTDAGAGHFQRAVRAARPVCGPGCFLQKIRQRKISFYATMQECICIARDLFTRDA
jgi:hypothetical protein